MLVTHEIKLNSQCSPSFNLETLGIYFKSMWSWDTPGNMSKGQVAWTLSLNWHGECLWKSLSLVQNFVTMISHTISNWFEFVGLITVTKIFTKAWDGLLLQLVPTTCHSDVFWRQFKGSDLSKGPVAVTCCLVCPSLKY